MKFRVARVLSVALLYLIVHLGLSACSGAQQDEQGLEVSDQNENSEQVADEQSGQQGEENSQQGEENYADQQSEEDLENENLEEGDDESELAEDETESDLQEIIQEMNSQQEVASVEGDEAIPTEEALANEVMEQAVPQDDMAAVEPAPVAGGNAPFQPGGTPAGQGLPEAGSKLPYIVQAGDTLAKIATRIYGDSARWREMSNLSGLANPSRIYPGDVVYYTLDEQSLAFATAYENVPRGQETVQAGDTLSTIASRVYGSHNAWKSIWRQNDTIDNPDRLEVGMTVYYVQSNTLAQEIQKAKAAVAELIKSESTQKVIKIVSSTNTVGFSG